MTFTEETKPLRILLVENNDEDAELIAEHFNKSDVPHEITVLKSTVIALDMLRSKSDQFDVLVTDHLMDEMMGLELCINMIEESIQLPKVLLTGSGSENLATIALKAGVDDYIIKDSWKGFGELLPVVLPEVVRKYNDRLARQKAEKALKESEELYRTLFENTGAATVMIDDDSTILAANSEFEILCRGGKEKIVGRKWSEFLVAEEAEKLNEYHKLRRKGDLTVPNKYEMKITDNTGKVRDIYFIVNLIPGTRISIASLIDLTKMKHLEEKERYLANVLETSMDAIFSVDIKRRIVSWNKGAERLFGYLPDEITGRSEECTIPSNLRKEMKSKVDDYLLKGALLQPFDTQRINKDGQVIDVSFSASPIIDEKGKIKGISAIARDITARKRAEEALKISEQRFREMADLLPQPVYETDLNGHISFLNRSGFELTGYSYADFDKGLSIYKMVIREESEDLRAGFLKAMNGEEFKGHEFTLQKRDGSKVPVIIYSTPILKGKSVLGLRGVFVDISERIAAEEDKRRLTERIQQGQKLESLGVMAAGIAHEFNNLLQGVLGNANMALMELSSVSRIRPRIDQIEKSAQRASVLTKQIMAFAGKEKLVRQRNNLSKIVEDMLQLSRVSISKKVNVILELSDNLPSVEVDASQVRQLVMNLILNAAEEIGNRESEIIVSTGVLDCDRTFLANTYVDDNLPEGKYAFIEVTDSACGMDAETVNRIFDPFFSTKSSRRGMGLAAVLGIIRGHNGAIKVVSELGTGTTITVFFPCCSQEAEVEITAPAKVPDWKGNGTVLVVDDEESVRMIAREMMEWLGFDVLIAEDGKEAIKTFNTRAKDITMILLDMSMPGLSGEEVIDQLRAAGSDVKIVVSSGFSEEETYERLGGKRIDGFIQKPFELALLSSKLKKLYDV